MSVEVTPVGNGCNINCLYCYQNEMRDADPRRPVIDLEAMKRGIEASGASTAEEVQARNGGQVGFSVFGGEPLLTPIETLEALWAWGLRRYGANGIQTNGSLITDEHLALFARYKVNVGISVDGPGPLNDARWAGSLEKTRAMTAKTEAAIDALCRSGRPPNLIVTLSRTNANAERLPTLIAWFAELAGRGVRYVNLHSLEVDHALVGEHLALDIEELIEVYRTLAVAQAEIGVRFEPFAAMAQLLTGDDRAASCIWHPCDPYTTGAVQGVDAAGERTNCGRTNKDGVQWRKPADVGYWRQLALYQTPQADGGCQGCRFFLQCKGQCPGEGIGGDWRNRTEKCGLWFALFEDFERQIVASGAVPLSLSPTRLRIERQAIDAWGRGQTPSLASLVQGAATSSRPLHADAPHAGGLHADAGHGDVPHGDEHGDHTDYGATPNA